jgi:hypothetical protein
MTPEELTPEAAASLFEVWRSRSVEIAVEVSTPGGPGFPHCTVVSVEFKPPSARLRNSQSGEETTLNLFEARSIVRGDPGLHVTLSNDSWMRFSVESL